MHTVAQIKDLAAEWVTQHADLIPGFVGAHLSGSLVFMEDSAKFPYYADVDIKVVVKDRSLFKKINDKEVFKGHLFDWSIQVLDFYKSSEVVLNDPIYAYLLAQPCVIADTNGYLTKLHNEVKAGFSDPLHVNRRCQKQKLNIEASIKRELPITLPLSNLVIVAGMRGLTIRKLLDLTYDILIKRGRGDLQELLLELVGSHDMTLKEVGYIVDLFLTAYDTAVSNYKTPLKSEPASANLHPYVRTYIIEGHRELIKKGRHRELIWWTLELFDQIIPVIKNDVSKTVGDKVLADYNRFMNRVGWLTQAQRLKKHEFSKKILPLFYEYIETDCGIRLN